MISDGLNGGEVPIELTLQVIAGSIAAVMGTATLITTLIAYMNPWIATIASVILILTVALLIADMYNSYYDYIYSGNPESYMDTQDKAFQLFILGDFELIMSQFIFANYMAPYLKKTGGATGESGSSSVVNSKGVAYPEVKDITTGQNMAPLLKDVHIKVVTPWWNGYGQ